MSLNLEKEERAIRLSLILINVGTKAMRSYLEDLMEKEFKNDYDRLYDEIINNANHKNLDSARKALGKVKKDEFDKLLFIVKFDSVVFDNNSLSGVLTLVLPVIYTK